MRNLSCLLVTLLLGSASAQESGVQIRFSAKVIGICEVQGHTDASVILHCTRDFRPADPHTLPGLYGQLPPQSLTMIGSSPAASGGTMNEYRVTDGDAHTFY